MTDDAQATPEGEFEYDVAFSLAGEDTGYVRPIAQRLRDVGVKVFYYEFDEAESWGADLPVFFDEIFRKTSRYAVLFIRGTTSGRSGRASNGRARRHARFSKPAPTFFRSASTTANFPACARLSAMSTLGSQAVTGSSS
jgi:hypothetical protein